MHGFYIFLNIVLNYCLRLFYRRVGSNGTPKELFGSTIYVCNHPASFMDPLIIGAFGMPVVYFMTRADVFNKATQSIFKAAHMLPIYRERDGVSTISANEKVFKKCAQLLNNRKNLLIFGEGETDDVFQRKLKPIKKGAARIGFLALETCNWEKKIYIAASGINYEAPNQMQSVVFIKTSPKICLNEFKESYLENPSKTITEVTNLIAKILEEQIIHVENKEWHTLVESVFKISQKGMVIYSNKNKKSLFNHWKYAKKMANLINDLAVKDPSLLEVLSTKMTNYFYAVKNAKVSDQVIYYLNKKGNVDLVRPLLKSILLFPFAILGFLHCALPYFLVKRFTEKTFKRPVFWGSVKMLVGMAVMGIINIPVIFLFHAFIIESYLLSISYYLIIGLFGLASILFLHQLTIIKNSLLTSRKDLRPLIKQRYELYQEIEKLGIE
jgi:hypothetical protein